MAFSLLRLLGLDAGNAAQARRFGDYQVVKLMHEGEKSCVYQARLGEEALYAIKAYRPGYNRTARRLAKRYHMRMEGEMGLLVNPPPGADPREHPIVRTIGFGWEFNDPGRGYYVVQEYLDGFNTKHMIACEHPLLKQRRLEAAWTVARGLGIIHERGFVHRDMCTDNVLMTRDGRAKLLDLGFMAPIGLSFREKSGTPSYMSPEQFQARPLNPVSDIYSFGVVLYEIFTGRLPFLTPYSSSNRDLVMRRMGDLMRQHLRNPPPPPSSVVPDLPEGMEEVILRCMEKAPEDRYQGVRPLLAALAQVRERNHNGRASG